MTLIAARELAHALSDDAMSSADYPAVYAWALDTSPQARAVRTTFARLCEACGANGYPYDMAFDALEVCSTVTASKAIDTARTGASGCSYMAWPCTRTLAAGFGTPSGYLASGRPS